MIGGLFGTDGISERTANAEYAAGIELDIVLNVVVVNLWADKDVVPNVVADAAAEVFHEVVAAGVVDTPAAEVAAGDYLRDVEACAGDTDAAHKIKPNFLAQTRLKEPVEVGQDGAVVFVFSGIVSLAGSPRGFNVKAKAALEANDVTADADIGATLFRRLLEEERGARG